MSEEIITINPDLPSEAPVSPETAVEESPLAVPADDETVTPAEEPSPDDDEKAPAPGSSSAYQKLLAKYGGDTEKMAAAIFEQYNSAARTHEELRELKAMLAEIKGSKEKEVNIEESIGEDPYVREVQGELASISEEAKQARDRQAELNVNYRKLEVEIAQLEGELRRADETEQWSLQQQLRDKRSDLKELVREFDSLKRHYSSLEKDWKAQQRNLKEAQARARTRVEGEREEALERQREGNVARREFNETLREEAQKYGIDPSSKAYAFINDSFRTQILAHMQSLAARGVKEAINIPEAVKFLMKEYSEATQLKPKVAKMSAEKAAIPTTRVPVKEPDPSSRRSAPRQGEQDARYWKDRARKLAP